MDFETYVRYVEELEIGKRLPSAHYVYRDKTISLGSELDELVARVVAAFGVGEDYNVIKFRRDTLKISFLAYPDFFSVAHPALLKAISLDLVSGNARLTDYERNQNPPILHRKETLLPRDHASYQKFAALTLAEEAAGLYKETATIGFRINWERLLVEKGVSIRGHTLIDRYILAGRDGGVSPSKESSPLPLVERHKTALIRYDLSKPVKTLLEYGILNRRQTFFDYGCGQGTDIRALEVLGYRAEGWDPVHRPSSEKRESDVVNLGYVLNVIEDPAERVTTLVAAYRLASRLLVVSALIRCTVEMSAATEYRDGVLTRRNTFQKYYDQQELQQFIEDALECTAVPAALGIFYVFRNPQDEQDFISSRYRRAIDWAQVSSRLGFEKPQPHWMFLFERHKSLVVEYGEIALRLGRLPSNGQFSGEQAIIEHFGSGKRALRTFVEAGGAPGLTWSVVRERFGFSRPAKRKWEILYEANQELLDCFWRRSLELGRLPEIDEFACSDELIANIGSLKKAFRIFVQKGGGDEFRNAAENRKRELLVYVALANLRKRVQFGHLSVALRRDIREFFGNYSRALQEGRELLFAAGDTGEIELACERLTLGWQDEQALYIHRSLLPDLPPILQAYVRCATILFGDVAQADVVKLHKSSGKVTFLAYEDFEGTASPRLLTRIKVNLRTRWVQVFDHSQEGQLLHDKGRLLRRPADKREAQVTSK